MATLGLFFFSLLLVGLLSGVLAVLNFWLWQKTKANSNLLMLIGAATWALIQILMSFGSMFGGYDWLWVIATALFVAGFYLSVKPMVAAQLAAMKAKLQQATNKVGGGGGSSGGGSTPAP